MSGQRLIACPDIKPLFPGTKFILIIPLYNPGSTPQHTEAYPIKRVYHEYLKEAQVNAIQENGSH